MKIEVGGFYRFRPRSVMGMQTTIAQIISMTYIDLKNGHLVQWKQWDTKGRPQRATERYTLLKDFEKMVECRVKPKEMRSREQQIAELRTLGYHNLADACEAGFNVGD